MQTRSFSHPLQTNGGVKRRSHVRILKSAQLRWQDSQLRHLTRSPQFVRQTSRRVQSAK